MSSQIEAKTTLIKICFEDQIRLLRVDEPTKLKKLIKSACQLFGVSKNVARISFKDKEGDEISIASDAEFQAVVKSIQGEETLKFFLSAKGREQQNTSIASLSDSSAVLTEEEQEESSNASSSSTIENINEEASKTKGKQQTIDEASTSSTPNTEDQIRTLKVQVREVKKSTREEVQKLKQQISYSKEEIQRVKKEKKKEIENLKVQILALKEKKRGDKGKQEGKEKKSPRKEPAERKREGKRKGEGEGKMKRKEQMEAFSQQLERLEAAGFDKRGRNFALLKKFSGDEAQVLQHLTQKREKNQKKDERKTTGRQEKRKEMKERI